MLECRVSPRRVFNFLRWLPDESVYKGLKAGGPEFVGWTHERTFLAMILEQEIFHRFEFVQANSSKKIKKAPKPLTIPGRKTEADTSPGGGFAAMLAKEKAYQAELAKKQE